MKKLSANWFLEGLIDHEYKQYILLAYLAEVRRYFEEAKLYPPLSDIIWHIQNLRRYQALKGELSEKFPQKLSGVDWNNLTLRYEKQTEDGATLQEIDHIIEYAIPALELHLHDGQNIYEEVEKWIKMQPVGLAPLYDREGYVMVRYVRESDTRIYYFKIDSFIHNEERVNGVTTKFYTTMQWSIATTYENMKLDLIRQNRELPNPATYLVETTKSYPLEETLLPITKRKLLRLTFKTEG